MFNLRHNLRGDNRAESGITLLLSILIMSGIFLISITVSFFVIQEIRASRSSLLTEPAITAADAGAEEGIWTVKRGNLSALPDCNESSPYGSPLGSGAVAVKCKSYSPVTLDLIAGQPTALYFYDPEDVNGNLCMTQFYTPEQFSGCSGYQIFESIKMTSTTSAVVTVDGRTLDGVAFSGWDNKSVVTDPATPTVITVPSSNPGSADYRFILTLTATNNVTVTLDATRRDHAGSVKNGLPDYPLVDSMGCAARGTINSNCTSSSGEVYRRRLNVTVPR